MINPKVLIADDDAPFHDVLAEALTDRVASCRNRGLSAGESDNKRQCAFDIKTGKELWNFKLLASRYGTPMTYRGKNGKQYVAVMTTGGLKLKWQLPIAS